MQVENFNFGVLALMPPMEGPPLPKAWGIHWPWYKAPALPVPAEAVPPSSSMVLMKSSPELRAAGNPEYTWVFSSDVPAYQAGGWTIA